MSSRGTAASGQGAPFGAATQADGRSAERPRLTRRGRLVLVMSLAVLMFGAFSLGRAGTTEASPQAFPTARVDVVTVQSGETLWAVAKRIAPEIDPRTVVDQLREINDMRSAELQVGQQLLLPTAA